MTSDDWIIVHDIACGCTLGDPECREHMAVAYEWVRAYPEQPEQP